MTWRVAASLETLLGQLNGLAPNRSKKSDGSIGDAAHASRSSDHNPWYGPGIVTARDFTHDPAGGVDGNWLAEALVRSRDPRIKYIIWNKRIISGNGGPSPWTWKPYNGINAHQHHVHVSVVASPAADDTRLWKLSGAAAPPPGPTTGPAKGPADLPTLRQGERSDDVMALHRFLTRGFPRYADFEPTGFYGPATVAAVKEFQKRSQITGPDADGTIIGPKTNAKLWDAGYRGKT